VQLTTLPVYLVDKRNVFAAALIARHVHLDRRRWLTWFRFFIGDEWFRVTIVRMLLVVVDDGSHFGQFTRVLATQHLFSLQSAKQI
jgi:hypothetical protein